MTIINILSQTYALYCLFMFYHVTKDELAHMQTFLKFFCIKVVIFFSWWQSLFISYLVHKQYIIGNKWDAAETVAHELEKLLITFEMFLFSIMFVVSFPITDFSGINEEFRIFPIEEVRPEVSKVCSCIPVKTSGIFYFYYNALYQIIMCVPTFVKLHPKSYKSNNNLLNFEVDQLKAPSEITVPPIEPEVVACADNSGALVEANEVSASVDKIYNIYYSVLVLLDSGFVSSAYNPLHSKTKKTLSKYNQENNAVCTDIQIDNVERCITPENVVQLPKSPLKNISLMNAILITTFPSELSADLNNLGRAVSMVVYLRC